MSRVGKVPIQVPAGVEVAISDDRIAVRGPKGSLERVIPSKITVREEGRSSSSGRTTSG